MFMHTLLETVWLIVSGKSDSSGQSSFTESYINLLKSGGKKHHREALAPFGLDASDPEFWNIGLNTISSLIDELEAA